MAVGESMLCTASYAVTQDDIDAGSVYNLAEADSNESGPDTDDHTEELPQNPLIDIVKTGTFDAGADGYADPGELISYEFTVSNAGNVSLTGVSVTDPLVGPVTCPQDTLAVGTRTADPVIRLVHVGHVRHQHHGGGHLTGHLAANIPDLAFQIADTRFHGVIPNEVAYGRLLDGNVTPVQAVLLDLLQHLEADRPEARIPCDGLEAGRLALGAVLEVLDREIEFRTQPRGRLLNIARHRR